MSTMKALGLLLATIVGIGAYLVLVSALGIREYWAGFLFLFQRGAMEEMKLDRLPRSVIGALGGTAIAFTPATLSPFLGANGASAVMLAVVLVAVFALLKGWLPVLVNLAMMLFLTVLTIPYVASGAAPARVFIGMASGILFFAGLAVVASRLAPARAQPAAV